MQLLTQHGAYHLGVVRDAPNLLIFRAPTAADLENLKAICRLDAPVHRVLFDPLGEYRLTLPVAQLPAVLTTLARLIDYPDLPARLETTLGQEKQANICRRLLNDLDDLQH
ncbi:MAG: hypothetical protein KIT44_09015 [Opitutaceae bacterium]|nr:hypothetical protein [Opitutaceae bacterium]